MRKSVLLLACVALAMVLVCGVAWADTFTVRNTNDSGPGSLRAAINEANGHPGADVITFAPSVRGTIGLKKALPTLHGEVEIRGPGAGKLTVRRSSPEDFRIFAVAEDATVTISGLKVSNGLAPGGPSMDGSPVLTGGAIHNERGVVSVRNCVFSQNRALLGGAIAAKRGGAISNKRGELTVVGSTFTGNISTDGGAIVNYFGGRLVVRGSTFSANRGGVPNRGTGGAINNSGFNSSTTVEGSTFSGNTAHFGGGISNNDGGTLTVSDSTFSRNEATGDSGGAVESSGFGFGNDGSILTVRNSTFSQNTALRRGGAIYMGEFAEAIVVGSTFSKNTAERGGGIQNSGGTLTLRNSTFWGNAASSENLARKRGGGLHNDSGHDRHGIVRVEGGTFTNNSAVDAGGGIYNDTSNNDTDFSLRMTIVSANDAPQGPDASGAFSGNGYNLIRDPSGATGFGGSDLTNTRAGLDPEGLKDNGGPTKTIALLSNSVAVDAVEEGCPPPATDQRGVGRPQNGDGEGEALCDIGAYERSAPSP